MSLKLDEEDEEGGGGGGEVLVESMTRKEVVVSNNSPTKTQHGRFVLRSRHFVVFVPTAHLVS